MIVDDKKPGRAKTGRQKKRRGKAPGRIAGMTVLLILLILAFIFGISDLFDAKKNAPAAEAADNMFYAVSSDNVAAISAFDRDGLAVLTDTSLKYFDSYGNSIGVSDCTFTNPVMKTAGKNVILFDRGAYSLKVEKSGTEFVSLSFSSIITTGAVCKNGSFAYALNADGGYQSHLYVCDRRGDKCFEWGCSSDYITDIALSDSGKYIAAAVMGADNAAYFSKIFLFGVGRGEPLYEVTLPDIAVYSVVFASSKKVAAYTDCGVYLFDSGGKLNTVQEYSATEMKLSSGANGNLGATVINKFGNEKNVLLTVFSKNYRLLYAGEYTSAAKYVSTSANYTAIAFADRIEIMNSASSIVGKISLEENCCGCVVSGRKVYVLTPGGIKAYSALSIS